LEAGIRFTVVVGKRARIEGWGIKRAIAQEENLRRRGREEAKIGLKEVLAVGLDTPLLGKNL
jgi:hypothetical protein